MNLNLQVQGISIKWFNSFQRKRQSVIVRNENNEIFLYTKGADSEI